MAGKTSAESPGSRLRVPKCLPVPGKAEQPYAQSREELKGLTYAEITLLVMESDGWKQAMAPILEAIDRERAAARKDRRGETARYSAEDIEKALLFQRVCGFKGYKEAHKELCGADSEARETLGFTGGPNRKKATRYLDGVPSRSTISRHLRRFGKERRGDAWDAVARAQRDLHLANFPEMRKEAEIAAIDGTSLLTHRTTPIIDPKTGEVVNADKVTCWDGGYVPASAGEHKSGNGWNLIPVTTSTGIPLAWSLPKLHESEPLQATLLVAEQFKDEVVPLLDPDRGIGVVTADGAFHSAPLRLALRSVGYVENIHHVSHADSPKSRKRASAERARRVPIENFPNWFADGHRQLVCACGKGLTFGRYDKLKDGRISVRVEGACFTCGSISITSGKWRLAQNPSRYVEVDPSNPAEEPDYLFGNPLTYDSKLAAEYGKKRFAHCEGFYGTLANRWGLIKGKRWFETVHEARADVGIIFSIIHVLAMEQRQRAALASAPPGLALAA